MALRKITRYQWGISVRESGSIWTGLIRANLLDVVKKSFRVIKETGFSAAFCGKNRRTFFKGPQIDRKQRASPQQCGHSSTLPESHQKAKKNRLERAATKEEAESPLEVKPHFSGSQRTFFRTETEEWLVFLRRIRCSADSEFFQAKMWAPFCSFKRELICYDGEAPPIGVAVQKHLGCIEHSFHGSAFNTIHQPPKKKLSPSLCWHIFCLTPSITPCPFPLPPIHALCACVFYRRVPLVDGW